MTSDEIKAEKIIERMHREYSELKARDMTPIDRDYAFRDIWFDKFAFHADSLNRLNHIYVTAYYNAMRVSLLCDAQTEYRLYNCKKYRLVPREESQEPRK